MKKLMRILCAAMLLVSFAACTEKENQEPSDTTGNGGNDTIVRQDMTPQYMQLSFYDGGSGLMDDGDPTHHNDFTWVEDGNTTSVHTDHHQFTFIIDSINATDCLYHSTYVEFVDGQAVTGDIRFHMTKIGDNPGGDPNQGDLGIGTPEQVGSTETSITVTAHVTGSVGEYLYQFPNYTCGLIWCAASDGTPTMSSNKIVCNTDSDGNFEGTINGLTAGTRYNMAAWLKLTPDSEPIVSDVRTYSTSNAPGQGENNWIRIDDIMNSSDTPNGLAIVVSGYFDGEPNGIGLVYNTTGNPTTSDQVYNAFDHLNMETGYHDETIDYTSVSDDGVHSVKIRLADLQYNTTYYIRGYIQFSDGTATVYSDESQASTLSGNK